MDNNVSYQIEASPQNILRQAQHARSCFEKMLNILCDVDKRVRNSGYSWSSESSRMLRDFFREDQEDFEEVKRAVSVQIAKLEEISARYADAERNAEADSESLPNTVLN